MKRNKILKPCILLAMVVIGSQSIWSQQSDRLPLVNEHQPLNWEDISLSLLVKEVEAAAKDEKLEDFAVVVRDNTISITYRDLQFPPDSPEITPETKTKIESLAKTLERFSNLRLLVEGHTAQVPEDTDDGTLLSGQRANAVANTIAGTGLFPREMISAVGQGQYLPIADNDTPEGRALNRRVEISISDEIEEERTAPQSVWWKQLTDWKNPGAAVFVVDSRLTDEAAVRQVLTEEAGRTGAEIGELPIFQTNQGIAVTYDQAEFTELNRPTLATSNEMIFISDTLTKLDPDTQVRIGGFGESIPEEQVSDRHYFLGLVAAKDSKIQPSSTLIGDKPQTFLFVQDCAEATGIIHGFEISANGSLPYARYGEFSDAGIGAGAKFDILIPKFQHLHGLAPLRFGLAVEGLYHIPDQTSSVESLNEFDWMVTVGYAVEVSPRFFITPHLGYGGTVQVLEYTQEKSSTAFTPVNGQSHYSQTLGLELDLALKPASWIMGETTQLGLFLRPGYRIFFDENFLGHSVTAKVGVRFYF
ncbi:OmpA family protein [Oceanispirochaeta crateris]|uniref:OmpA family protein n=1 Tax=Oceanispirochaeta crateris TaxID=2518645 RepID=A0A5C1QP11_9SPIO|nr:OmpA family protein [Oceanispirochaeta crateris]QEN08969.1 OmpA family protein [Oceanispirochaeta crateris]